MKNDSGDGRGRPAVARTRFAPTGRSCLALPPPFVFLLFFVEVTSAAAYRVVSRRT